MENIKNKKKLRVFGCLECGDEVRTYNRHQKYCTRCRAERECQQLQEARRRRDAKKARQREDEQPIDPNKEQRIQNLIKFHEIQDQLLRAHGLNPSQCSALAAIAVLEQEMGMQMHYGGKPIEEIKNNHTEENTK